MHCYDCAGTASKVTLHERTLSCRPGEGATRALIVTRDRYFGIEQTAAYDQIGL